MGLLSILWNVGLVFFLTLPALKWTNPRRFMLSLHYFHSGPLHTGFNTALISGVLGTPVIISARTNHPWQLSPSPSPRWRNANRSHLFQQRFVFCFYFIVQPAFLRKRGHICDHVLSVPLLPGPRHPATHCLTWAACRGELWRAAVLGRRLQCKPRRGHGHRPRQAGLCRAPKKPWGELTPSYAWHERNINRKRKATGNLATEVSPFIEALFLLALLLCLMSVKSIRFLALLRPWVGKI